MSPAAPRVTRVVNRGVAANTYLYRLPSSNECVVIDPGLDRESIEEALQQSGLSPRAIFCTHGHFDHVGTAEHLRREHQIDIHLHDADAGITRSANFTMMVLKMPWRIDVPSSFVPMDEDTVWTSGDARMEVLHVPGHTPGSVVMLIDGLAFTGDTLYRQDIWLGSMPESDHNQLVESLHRLWDTLPEDVMVYPGHGGSATFREIRQSNMPLRELLGITAGVGVPPS